MSKNFVRKTAEELHREYIESLVEERDFQQPTISYLTKCNQIKLPILCDKCLDATTQNDEIETVENIHDEQLNQIYGDDNTADMDYLKPVVGTYLSYLTPCGTCEFNKKLCILYNKHRKSISSSTNSSPHSSNQSTPMLSSMGQPLKFSPRKNIASAPPKKSSPMATHDDIKENVNAYENLPKSGKHVQIASNERATSVNRVASSNRPKLQQSQNIGYNNSSSVNAPPYTPVKSASRRTKSTVPSNEDEGPMLVGDIRRKLTSKGLEIKRLSTKNNLIVDIYTNDVCHDQNQKVYIEWMSRQREDQDLRSQQLPSKMLEKQLQEVLASMKRGALTYDVWAKQSYEVLVLKKKIKVARKREEANRNKRIAEAKAQEVKNTFELWKISKAFARSKYSNNMNSPTNNSYNNFSSLNASSKKA